ncbi:low-specificity L-threonine aldolase [uncultured Tateyamaria sp.]|uniref:low-specificity L-threonine aldolase n=1 Tax=uncultured Tateyamaria sp. TaxID=455651 RepID=UPI0026139A1B|nr:low-specificity L-threonine aldolase [uncultured Tateyamaria sp.]
MTQYASTQLTTDIIADLRSDTVTAPDAAMRAAMADAEVGDDVYGEDATVNRLEAELAERLGKEAGLFLTSGTQSNLVGMLAHCQRGDEIITGRGYHIYKYEAAGASVLGGVALDPLDVARDGALEPDAITAAVKDDDPHHAITRLLGLENTHNGHAVSLARCQQAADAARAAGLSVHLDGARFFNAAEVLGCTETDLAGIFDTVSICLSKGLGAPVGSVLVGQRDLIARARRWRKMLGGGTRQSGILAAAGLHALRHNVDRLTEDRQRAARLGQALSAYGDVTQATNMVFFTPKNGITPQIISRLAASGVRLSGALGTTRLVLHKDVTDEGLETAISGFERALA